MNTELLIENKRKHEVDKLRSKDQFLDLEQPQFPPVPQTS
jgi:hypothetical protein